MAVSFLHALPPITCCVDVVSTDDGVRFINEKESVSTQLFNNLERHASLKAAPHSEIDPFKSAMTWTHLHSRYQDLLFQSMWQTLSTFLNKGTRTPHAEKQESPRSSTLVSDSDLSTRSTHSTQSTLITPRHMPVVHMCPCSSDSTPAPRIIVKGSAQDNYKSRCLTSDTRPDCVGNTNTVAGRAALQQQPPWTHSHSYMRDLRANPAELRMLSAERAMMWESKLTRPLKNRRYLDKRKDAFVWGTPSCLRFDRVGE